MGGGLALGAASALVGLVPWLMTGARLPLQNLWRRDVLPDSMPVALLPISQYYSTRILVMLLIGGVLAGSVARLLRRRFPTTDWATAVGILTVQAVATIQAFVVVADGLGIVARDADSRALLYFAGMLGGTIVSVALAQALFWLISRRSVAPAALGLALAAVPFASWLLVTVVFVSGPTGPPLVVGELYRWLPAVIVGAALGWCGVVPVRRLGVWVAGLLALFVAPAVFTASSYALGMRVLDGDLREMADAAVQIFPRALVPGVAPTVLAFLIAAAVTAIRWAIARGQPKVPAEA
ncbi:hypothetical protein HNO83_16635 [Leifsonia sp. C5G2]|nr:hypothetical protein [Leifsonia sp. C5G2]